MGLTVTEKDHFKQRIREKADALRAKVLDEAPDWKKEITAEAVKQLEKQFGVQELMKELEAMKVEREALSERIVALQDKICSTMVGLIPQDLEDMRASHHRQAYQLPRADRFRRYPGEAREIMQRACAYRVAQLESQHPVGAKVAEIDDLEAEAIDDISVCGSHAQLNTLWKDLKQKFGIVEKGTTRANRKVDISRAEAKKAQK